MTDHPRSGSVPPPAWQNDDGERSINFPSRRRLTQQHGEKSAIGYAGDQTRPAPGKVHVTMEGGETVNHKDAPHKHKGVRRERVSDAEFTHQTNIARLADGVFYIKNVVEKPAFADSRKARAFAQGINAVFFDMKLGSIEVLPDRITAETAWPPEPGVLNGRISVKDFLSDGAKARAFLREPDNADLLRTAMLEKRRALMANAPASGVEPPRAPGQG